MLFSTYSYQRGLSEVTSFFPISWPYIDDHAMSYTEVKIQFSFFYEQADSSTNLKRFPTWNQESTFQKG